MYTYRNRNTGDEVGYDEPNPRLEQLPNWDRISGPEPEPPAFDPAEHTAADVLAYIDTADRDEALRVLDLEAGDGKQRTTVLAARAGVEARES